MAKKRINPNKARTLYEDNEIEVAEFQRITKYTDVKTGEKKEKVRTSIATLRKMRDPNKIRSNEIKLNYTQVYIYSHALDGKV